MDSDSKLTEEQRVIIREEQRKNFFKRAMPFGLLGIVVGQTLIHRGIVSANKSFFKIMGFGFTGFIIGRISGVAELRRRLLNEAPGGQFVPDGMPMPDQRQPYTRPDERKSFIPEYPARKSPSWAGDNVPQETRMMPTNADSYPRPDSRDTLDNRLAPTVDPLDSVLNPRQSQPPPPAQEGFSYAQQRSQWKNEGLPQQQPEQGLDNVPGTSGKRGRRNVYGDLLD